MKRKLAAAVLVLLVMTLTGCRRKPLDFGTPVPWLGSGDSTSEDAANASEHTPPSEVLGKTYDKGPVVLWNTTTTRKEK